MSELEPSPRFYTRDLAGVGFVAGFRVLVDAATRLPPPLALVVCHPPAMLARIAEVGWGRVVGLRLEPSRAAASVAVESEPQ